jgi:cytochrome c peroxidase
VAAELAFPDLSDTTIINEPIQPIPLFIELDQERVALGRQLFHEPQLSTTNTVSCSSCHILSTGGVDHLQYAIGIDDLVGTVNTPTVFNSGFNFRQFWDGRADSLESRWQVHSQSVEWDQAGMKFSAS